MAGNGGASMTAKILAGLNLLIVAAVLLYSPDGEDPAGAGMRLGAGVAYALVLGALLLLYRKCRTRWVRLPLLCLLALPLLAIPLSAL